MGKLLPDSGRRQASPEGLWSPLPGPQTAAFLSEADEVFYGGAAGGGKTDLLCGWGITGAKVGAIYRREYPQLRSIIDRLLEIVPGADFNKVENRLRLGERTLELGAVQYERDWQKYQGRAKDYVGFDELPTFLRTQYRMLITWLRTTDPHQRCRVIATGNPPVSEEQMWVIEEWAPWLDPGYSNPAADGELRWYVYDGDRLVWVAGPEPVELDDGRRVEPRSRTFISARLEDNPHLMQTGYARTLDALPDALRRAFRDGDFTAGIEEDPWQVIPRAWVEAAQARWTAEPPADLSALGVDPARGGRDETVIAPRHGHWVAPLATFAGSTTPDGPTVAAQVLRLHGPSARIVVDGIGIGAGVVDALAAHDLDLVSYIGSAASEAKDKTGKFGFRNLRAASWWSMRELLDPQSGMDIALPPDSKLKADLCAPRFTLTVRGIKVEAKEDVIKRLGRSPDRADAVIYAFHDPPPAGGTGWL